MNKKTNCIPTEISTSAIDVLVKQASLSAVAVSVPSWCCLAESLILWCVGVLRGSKKRNLSPCTHAQICNGNPPFSVYLLFNCLSSQQSLGQLRATATQLRTAAVLASCSVTKGERRSDESSGIDAADRACIGFQLCQVNRLFAQISKNRRLLLCAMCMIHVFAFYACSRFVEPAFQPLGSSIACCSYDTYPLPTLQKSLIAATAMLSAVHPRQKPHSRRFYCTTFCAASCERHQSTTNKFNHAACFLSTTFDEVSTAKVLVRSNCRFAYRQYCLSA